MTLQEIRQQNRERHEAFPKPYRLVESPDEDAAIDMRRIRDDFAYWAYKCVKIKDKVTGRAMPFRLNGPQMRVLGQIEHQRLAGQPIRLIMLKARQWGGSTLVQMYMAWIQCVLKTNWNSLICGHVKDASVTIREMYSTMLQLYPGEAWAGEVPCAVAFRKTADDGPSKFVRVPGALNICEIAGRGCRVTVATAERENSVRGQDIKMAHLSEVAFWPSTVRHDPMDLVRTVFSGIPLEPLTLIALESTANGVGSYFHTEWVRAEAGESDKMPVFVPWYWIEMYRRPIPEGEELEVWELLDAYEQKLWADHPEVTLEALWWYHTKRREFQTHEAMMAEFPSSAVEAFVSTGAEVFNPEHVDRMRRACAPPLMTGEVSVGADGKPRFTQDRKGLLQVWREPEGPRVHSRYVAVVDVGGRSAGADWSVIAVFERREKEVPRVVAQWRGHTDHDLLAQKAMDIARYYQNALLVVESNTLESEWDGDGTYVLERVGRKYNNLYYRRTPEGQPRAGFHTNRSTKQLAIGALVEAVREGGYQEACVDAVNELDTYECTREGGYAARRGCHDDMLMTRAIGLYVMGSLPRLRFDDDPRVLLRMPSW